MADTKEDAKTENTRLLSRAYTKFTSLDFLTNAKSKSGRGMHFSPFNPMANSYLLYAEKPNKILPCTISRYYHSLLRNIHEFPVDFHSFSLSTKNCCSYNY